MLASRIASRVKDVAQVAPESSSGSGVGLPALSLTAMSRFPSALLCSTSHQIQLRVPILSLSWCLVFACAPIRTSVFSLLPRRVAAAPRLGG